MPPPPVVGAEPSVLPRRGLVRSLAVVSAVAVTVTYAPQPLVAPVAADFSITQSAASVAAAAVQLGYAVGLLMLLPLADVTRPRRQVQAQLLVSAGFLLLAAAAQDIWQLSVCLFLAGCTSNIAQILLPLAVRLSPPDSRAASAALLTGALLFGVFGIRIVFGPLVDHLGWRLPLALLAAALLLLLPLVRSAISSGQPAALSGSYRQALRSLPAVALHTPGLLRSTGAQMAFFAVFNALWTISTLHLLDLGWSASSAGLVAVVGIAAGLATQRVGPLVDRYGPPVALRISMVVGVASLALIAVDAAWALVAGLFVLTLGNQAAQVANQSLVLRVAATGGRANAVYMSGTFLGGAFGAGAGVALYEAQGLAVTAVTGIGLLLAVLFTIAALRPRVTA